MTSNNYYQKALQNFGKKKDASSKENFSFIGDKTVDTSKNELINYSSLTSKFFLVVINIIIWLDNASIYSYDSTKRLFAYLNLNAFYLSPYWPHLAPVKLLFKIIKSKIRSKFWVKEINFDKNSVMEWIHSFLLETSTLYVKQI